MRLFGFEITRKTLQAVPSHGSWWGPWWGPITEPYAGAWQKNVEYAPTQTLLSFSAVYACVTGIASDIAKLRLRLMREDDDGIWTEVKKESPYLPVLRKPNHYQTSIKFIEQWIISKLLHGNTYVLKERDKRGVVSSLYILHPSNVKALVADNGDVYYEIHHDDLSRTDEITDPYALGREDRLAIPASEIIHDMMVSLWHPLVGVSPLYACAMGATLGAKIIENGAQFFANQSMPGGILTAPGAIKDETAARMKATFEANFSGANRGRVAVLGDGLKFEAIRMTAEAAQTVEHAQLTVQDVARAFRYPLHKLNGQAPPYAGSVEASQVAYYSDCLQPIIEALEYSFDDGLSLPRTDAVELDTDLLLRMDTAAMLEAMDKGRNIMTPNEARKRINLPPVTGGNSVYRQEQDHSLAALAARDAQAVGAFAEAASNVGELAPALPAALLPAPGDSGDADDADEDDEEDDDIERALAEVLRKELCL